MPDEIDLSAGLLPESPKPRRGGISRDRILQIARSDNIPDDIADDFAKVMNFESGGSHFDRRGKVKLSPPDPKTGERAVGAVQIKPSTARGVGVDDPFDEEKNLLAGLRYFRAGGDDPTARRIHYFGGPRPAQQYRRTGRIPKGRDVLGTTFEKYVQSTGGQQKQKPKIDLSAGLVGDLDAGLEDSEQILPAKRQSGIKRQIPPVSANQSKAQSAPSTSPFSRMARRAAQAAQPPDQIDTIDAGNAVPFDPRTMKSTVLPDRLRASADFSGEEYKNFLLLNRSLDSPRQREAFVTLKTKQATAAAGSPEAAVAEMDRQQRVARMPTSAKVAQAAKGIPLGLAQGAGTTLKSIGVAAKKLNLFGEYEGEQASDLATYQAGEYIQKWARDSLQSNPDLEKEFWVGQAPQAIGQATTFLLGGLATKAPKLTTVILGGGMVTGDAYDEVKAAGGTDEQAVNAGVLAGAILGPTELLGTWRMIKALEGTPYADNIKRALAKSLVDGTNDAVWNSVQEAGQEYVQGKITGVPREADQLLRAAALGAIASGPTTTAVSGAGQLLGGRRARQVEAQPDVTAQPVEAQRQPAQEASAPVVGDVLQPEVRRETGQTGQSTAPVEPQRFYHKDYGEVELLADQTGAGKSKYRVAEVADPTKQHFVKKAHLTGKGNQRMVPIKPESAVENLDSGVVEPADAQPVRAETAASKPESLGITKPSSGETTAAGFRSDLSLSQFVRKMGGIVPAEMYRGELDRIRMRETGTTGLINQKAKQGDIPQTVDIMMQAANDAGYRDPKTGQPFENPGDFLYAVERDVLGDKVRVQAGDEVDWDAKIREYEASQQPDIEIASRDADARVALLESDQSGVLYDRIGEGKANESDIEQFRKYASEAGLSAAGTEDLIASARTSSIEETAGVQAETGHPEQAREVEVVKPWEMTREQIEQEFERKKAEDASIEESVLGPELAQKYKRLQRAANSSYDTEKADRASDEIERIEASLSEQDRNRLYGIGEEGPQVEDLRDYRQSLSNLDDSDPQSLAQSMRWAVSRVGSESDPTKMSHEQQVAFGTLREAARIAHERGWDTQAISREAVKAAGQRFADPDDARFVLDRFLKKEKPPQAPKPKQLRPAEQLGFVQEGLTQQASPPPQPFDKREQLLREEQDRQAQLDPARTEAHAKLAELKRRGLTVDDYARQPDLEGNIPTAEEVARLREVESGEQASDLDHPKMFGPGTMRAGEPLPEVKERKFGKRFVEDERIADEIRSEIGTAKYYEPIPNKITAEQAKKLVDERGIGESIRIIRDEKNDLAPHVRATMGQTVILKLNQTYRNLKAAGSEKADGVLEQAVDLAEWAMDYGTRLGQGVQSFAMWARLTPEGKLLQYKRFVKKARERHQKMFGEDVAEIVNTVNKDMTDAERAEALKNLFNTNKTAKKVKTDFDKILEAAKSGKLTDALFYEIVGDKLGLPGYNRETAQKITDLANQIEAAPEGLPRTKLVLELQKFIAEQKGFDVADLPLGIFYGNILSGYNTHAVNFADTGLNVLSEINGLALNNPQAAAKIYAGMLRGFAEGRWDAMLALTEGRMFRDSKWLDAPGLMEVAKFGQKGGVPIKTETRTGRLAKRAAESKIATPLNAYKYVSRAMSASDAVMARSAGEARATLLSYKMAKEEGLKGDALEARVREILALDRAADFEAQAKREGFTGKEAAFRAHELREMARPKDLTADAAEFAGEATYNHTPHGTLGLIAERVGKLADDVKPLKLFVPFTRIVANVTNRGLNYTPYGYKRAVAGWGFGKNAEPLTAEERRLMLTRATMGTAGMVLLGVLQEAGVIAIHGNGPSDREKRRQLQNAGWRPYSLQIGKTYISYVYSPVGLGLSIIGNMKDSTRYHELEQKDAATRGAYAVARLGSTIFSQSFLSGLSRLFGALSEEPSKSVASVKQTLGGTVAAFGVPNIVRDMHRLFDNKAYQSTTLGEDLIRNTPFAALALRPTLNAFGEPVKLQRQRFFDIQTSDPAWKFVIEKNLRVPVPGRTIEIAKGRRITPEEYHDLLKTTGPKVKDWIIKNRTRLSKMKEQDAQDELSEAATRIRKFELVKMKMRVRKKAA